MEVRTVQVQERDECLRHELKKDRGDAIGDADCLFVGKFVVQAVQIDDVRVANRCIGWQLGIDWREVFKSVRSQKWRKSKGYILGKPRELMASQIPHVRTQIPSYDCWILGSTPTGTQWNNRTGPS